MKAAWKMGLKYVPKPTPDIVRITLGAFAATLVTAIVSLGEMVVSIQYSGVPAADIEPLPAVAMAATALIRPATSVDRLAESSAMLILIVAIFAFAVARLAFVVARVAVVKLSCEESTAELVVNAAIFALAIATLAFVVARFAFAVARFAPRFPILELKAALNNETLRFVNASCCALAAIYGTQGAEKSMCFVRYGT